jgi:hypothetical protein
LVSIIVKFAVVINIVVVDVVVVIVVIVLVVVIIVFLNFLVLKLNVQLLQDEPSDFRFVPPSV